MYKVDLPLDYKEMAAIERRRIMEEERKSRIFNARERIIGIDEQALQQQIKDKKHMEEMEKRRNEAFEADAVRNDRIAQLLQRRQEQDMKELQRAENEFRALHQRPEDRREWDLYDPDALKKDRPARVSDNDPRCGPASMQKFLGEDLNSKARRKFQNEQQREWAAQQKAEHDKAKDREKEAQRLHDLKQLQLEQRILELAKAEEDCKRAVQLANSDYNRALAREQDARRQISKQQEEDDKLTDMANHVFGDFLSENPGQAQSAFGPHRVVPDRWKGMTPEQITEIQREQERQRKDKEREREEEKRLNEEWDSQRLAQAKAAEALEAEEENRRRQRLREDTEENKRLAREQIAYQDYLNNQLYTNKPTAAYFTQFNTTTR